MDNHNKPLVWLNTAIKTPPFSKKARIEAGTLLRQLQWGGKLSLPQSRPMPSIGIRCHELRIADGDAFWRIIYCLDTDAIIILASFKKKTQTTPKHVISLCQERLRLYQKHSQ